MLPNATKKHKFYSVMDALGLRDFYRRKLFQTIRTCTVTRTKFYRRTERLQKPWTVVYESPTDCQIT